jgi:hypothetical protein
LESFKFGRNAESYKFALAESLFELAPTEKTEISFEELADPYSLHICEHLKTIPKQVTSRRSQFLEDCNKFNKGEILHDELISIMVEKMV